MRKKYLPKDIVLQKWKERGYSGSQIARRYNVSKHTVQRAFKKAGISLQEKRDFPITKEFSDFINGLLLGDGHMGVSSLYRKSDLKPKGAKYAHCDKNGTYLLWLKKVLEAFGITSPPVRQIDTYCLESFIVSGLLIFWKTWYPHGKKEIPSDIVFTPITLFNLFLGDGCYAKGKYKRIFITKLDSCWKQVISDALHNLGINNTIHKRHIFILKNSHERFFQYICEIPYFIPKAYYYKIPPEYIQYNRCWALIEKYKRSGNARP